MRIIPAIDIIDGKCVRLSQGDYAQKTVYNENPLEVAKAFEGAGIEYLHLVDLDGAKARKPINLNVLETIASNTNLQIDAGGGIQDKEAVKAVFSAGAKQVTGGSIAAREPEEFQSWIEQYGSEKIILGADAKDGYIAVHGWQQQTDQPVDQFVTSYLAKGLEYVICTDIARDGMLIGPAFDLYQKLLSQNPTIKLIASGGVSSLDDVDKLKTLGLEGVIIGKALYEGKISLKAIGDYL